MIRSNDHVRSVEHCQTDQCSPTTGGNAAILPQHTIERIHCATARCALPPPCDADRLLYFAVDPAPPRDTPCVGILVYGGPLRGINAYCPLVIALSSRW